MENTPTHMVFESSSHWARVSRDGLIQVYSRTPPVLTTYSYDASGRVSSQSVAKVNDGSASGDLLGAMFRWPVLAAVAGHEPKRWHVDADAGFQRWRGRQLETDIRWALTQCGFADYADSIIAYCSTKDHLSCPWQVP